MSHHPPVNRIYRRLRTVIACTLDRVKTHQLPVTSFDQIVNLCRCVPLTNAEFQVLTRRARSAEEYCQQGQFGAGAFELRMLLKTVERLITVHDRALQTQHFVFLRRSDRRIVDRYTPPTTHA